MKLSYGIRKNAPAKSHASLAKAAFTILIVAVFLLGSPVFAYADDPGDSYAPFEAATGSGSGGGSEDTVPATPSAEEGAEPDP
ncbi:MAG: hypothetical protein GX250_03980, partial [Clostridiales bacterium]|nr:hypothetical protein [Clostridiales bacterium]